MVIHDLRGPATSINLGSEIVLKSIKEFIHGYQIENFDDQVSFITKGVPVLRAFSPTHNNQNGTKLTYKPLSQHFELLNSQEKVPHAL